MGQPMPKVVVSENIAGEPLERLAEEFEVVIRPDLWQHPTQLVEQVADAQAILVRNQTQVTAELIAKGPALQIIARAGAGLDNIDTQAASQAGIVVSYAPRENSVSVAELTLALMLSLARQVTAADLDTRRGGWDRRRFTGSELFGKTLGVVGLGKIGTLSAARAKAFGMRLIAHDDYVDPDDPRLGDLGVELLDLSALLQQADFVSCHVPLTSDTRGMFDYRRFREMKSSAFFINASRGEVVDEAGLVQALNEQRIAGAGLDVRETEPPPDDSPLAELPNVILTPHIGAFTHEAQDRVVAAVCRDVQAVLSGRAAENHFNFDRPV